MQELEKILEEIEAEFDRRIDIQLKIMAGLGDDVYRYGYGKSLEAYQQGKLFVEDIIRKYMNDGWISVEKFGLPHSNEHDFRFWVTIQYTNGFRHTIKAKWDCFDKCFIHQNGKKILQDVIAYKYYSAPEPYRPERSDNHDRK